VLKNYFLVIRILHYYNDIAGVPEQKKTPIQWWLLFGLALSLLAIFAGSVGFLYGKVLESGVLIILYSGDGLLLILFGG
jgi:hypothetical protein